MTPSSDQQPAIAGRRDTAWAPLEMPGGRQVLEAHLRATEIEDVEQPACGLGFAADREWGLTLRVQTPGGTRYVVVDRHD